VKDPLLSALSNQPGLVNNMHCPIFYGFSCSIKNVGTVLKLFLRYSNLTWESIIELVIESVSTSAYEQKIG